MRSRPKTSYWLTARSYTLAPTNSLFLIAFSRLISSIPLFFVCFSLLCRHRYPPRLPFSSSSSFLVINDSVVFIFLLHHRIAFFFYFVLRPFPPPTLSSSLVVLFFHLPHLFFLRFLMITEYHLLLVLFSFHFLVLRLCGIRICLLNVL